MQHYGNLLTVKYYEKIKIYRFSLSFYLPNVICVFDTTKYFHKIFLLFISTLLKPISSG